MAEPCPNCGATNTYALIGNLWQCRKCWRTFKSKTTHSTHSSSNPPQEALLARMMPEERVAYARAKARKFKEALKEKGYFTYYEETPSGALVDFYPRDIREETAKMSEDEAYAMIGSSGSLEFKDDIVEGEFPLQMYRKPEAKGFRRKTVEVPRGIPITELHPHVWDHKPMVHIHIYGPTPLDKLIDFVTEVRAASREFLYM